MRYALLLLLALGLVGCSRSDKWRDKRPARVPAAGVIKHNGQPLANAVIVLAPVNGNTSAFGRSGGDGRFTLTTFDPDDGAVAGDYRVSVTKVTIDYEPNPKNPTVLPPLYHAEQSMVPDTYGDPAKSGLQLTIPSEGTKDLTLELTGDPGKLKVIVARKRSDSGPSD